MRLNIFTVLTLLLKVVSLYFLVIGLFALKKPKPIPSAAPATRFACLIAARNEEAVIGALVESLRNQNYPAELFDVYVIPNNCTDETEGVARRAGAQIFRCFGAVRRKGDAPERTAALMSQLRSTVKKSFPAQSPSTAKIFRAAGFMLRM